MAGRGTDIILGGNPKVGVQVKPVFYQFKETVHKKKIQPSVSFHQFNEKVLFPFL